MGLTHFFKSASQAETNNILCIENRLGQIWTKLVLDYIFVILAGKSYLTLEI